MKFKMSENSLTDCLSTIIDYRGKTPKKLGGDWSDTGYRAISANHVKFNGLQKEESIRFVSEDMYRKWMKEEIKRGDILLTSEAPAGQVMIWDSDEKIVLSQRLFALRVNEKLDNRYLKYYLQSATGQHEILKHTSGSTVFGISAKTFKIITVRYPDKLSQQKVGNLLSCLDNKIELNNCINTELENLAKTIYDYWFVQFDFPDKNGKPYKASGGKMVYNQELKRSIPKGWSVGKLGDIGKNIRNGIKESDIDPEMFYIGLEHIPRKNIALDSWEKALDLKSNKFSFVSGNILFGKLRPYFHKVGVAFISGVCSTDILVLDSRQKNDFGYFLMIISSDDFINYVTVATEGTRMPRTNWEHMQNYLIPIPENTILERFNDILIPLISQMKNNVLQNQQLTELRDWLLPMLMNGQVTVK